MKSNSTNMNNIIGSESTISKALGTFSKEITLKFDTNNKVIRGFVNTNQENEPEDLCLNKHISDLFQDKILYEYNRAISIVRKGNIEQINYTDHGYSYDVLLTPCYEKEKYNGFLAIISSHKISHNIINDSEDYYSIFEDNDKCVVVYDIVNNGNDFVFRYFNKSAERLEKISRYDVIGKNVKDVFPKVNEFGIYDIFKRVAKTGRTEKLESKYYKDYRIEGYRENYIYKIDNNKLIVFYEDITENKNILNTFKIGNTDIEAINNIKNEGVVFVKNNVILKINQKAIEIFGYDNNTDIIGNSLYKFIDSKYSKLINQFTTNDKGEKFIISTKRNNGDILNIEGYSKQIRTPLYGKIDVFYFIDITEELNKSNKLKLLSTATEQSANSIVITDTEGNIEYVNPYFTEITGYTLEEAIGKNPRILKSGTQDEEFYKELWDTISNGNVWSGTFNNITKDGISFWERAKISPVTNKHNKITNYIAIKENITKEYILLKALEESEHKFKNLISKAPISIVIINIDGVLEYINTNLFNVLNINISNNSGIPYSYNIFKDEQLFSTGTIEALQKVFDGKTIEFPIINYDFEFLKTKYQIETNLKKIYLKATGFPINDENGVVKQAVLMIENLNEKKIQELTRSVIFNIMKTASKSNSLTKLTEKIRLEMGRLLDTTNFFIALYNKERNILYSPYFTDEKDKFNEFPAEFTLSKYVIDTKKSLLADKTIRKKLVAEGKIKTIGTKSKIWLGVPIIIKDEAIGVYAVQSYSDENAYSKKDIEIFEFIANQISIYIHKKQIETNLIKKNKELEETNNKLLIAKQKAEESERLTNAFLANMSHEIRTPMNGILGFTQLLLEPEVSKEEVFEYARIIEKSGNRLLNIINELIEISKIEANKTSIKKAKYFINNQVREIFHFFKLEAESKLIDLIYLNDNAGKDLEIFTDEDKVHAILTNLLKNAIKYTKKGKVEFGYKIHKNSLEFFVKDTGIGIPKKRQKAIFDRFVQADIEDRNAYEGAGLGLTIAMSYAKILGGKILLESEENKGSIFTFILPIEIPSKIWQKTTEYISNNISNRYINTLIVDDEKVSFLYLDAALKEICSPMHYAQNSDEALQILEDNKNIQLVLMDIKMPNMNGYELTSIIKSKYPDIIIIAQTAFALGGDREKAIDVGCDGYIAKPVNRQELITLIQKLFNL